jgi:hypothetical protein
MFYRFLGISLAVLLLPLFSGAQIIWDLSAAVDPGGRLTYRSLVAGVFPGLREDSKSGNLIMTSEAEFRRMGETERTVLPVGTRLASFSAVRVRGDGARYVVLMCEAETGATEVPGGGAAILAAFPEGQAQPLDTVDVKTDVLCFFGEEPPLSLGSEDAFSVVNHHFNSSQGYVDTLLAHVRGGRFQAIGSVFTLNVGGLCENSFREVLTWRAEKDAAAGPFKVVATVRLTRGPGEKDSPECLERKLKVRVDVFSETYRWDKGRQAYAAVGRGFQALDRFNQEKF